MIRSRLKYILSLILVTCSSPLWSKTVTDTLATKLGDKVIITYSIVQSGTDITVSANGADIRFLPTDKLRKRCDGNLTKLKVIVFDRVGGYAATKFTGEQPKAFGIPSNVSHSKSYDGYYILGESSPIQFKVKDKNRSSFGITAFIALYEKKNTYRLLGQTKKNIVVNVNAVPSGGASSGTKSYGKEMIAIKSTAELDGDNEDITQALECINAVEERLQTITQLPFPRSLEADVEVLYSMKRRITDAAIRARIENALQMYENKEKELTDEQQAAARKEQSEAQALQEKQRQEDLQRRQAAEEKARQDAEKQQKRNLWLLIGGAIFAVLCFVFNGVFRHFRDIRNQKSMFEMQQSITQQAEREAARRARQVVRNKTHQVVNQGKTKARTAVRNGINKKNTGMKSI